MYRPPFDPYPPRRFGPGMYAGNPAGGSAPGFQNMPPGPFAGPGDHLMQILSSQKESSRLQLTEMYIGDQGCSVLKEFLRKYSNYTVIDLKGNNISPNGFQQLVESLRLCKGLTALNLEWNNLGADPKGVENLCTLIPELPKLKHLDLRNNKIGADSAALLSAVLSKNKTLVSLDLRWNELGTQGAQALLTGLKENKQLQNLEINGNNVTEAVTKEIKKLLEKSFKDNPREEPSFRAASSGYRFYQEQNLPPPELGIPGPMIRVPGGMRVMDNSFNDRVPISEFVLQEQREVIQGLEETNNVYRVENEELKRNMERTHEMSRRRDMAEHGAIQELEIRLQSMASDNRGLVLDVERMREEIENLRRGRSEHLSIQDERIHKFEAEINELQHRQRGELDKLHGEHGNRIREINAEWENRLKPLEEKLRSLQIANEDLQIEIRRLSDNAVNLKMTHEEEIRDLQHRIHEEELHKYHTNLKSLESRMMVLEEGREVVSRKHSEIIKELESKVRRVSDELNSLEKENQKLIAKNDELKQGNREYDQLSEKLKQDLKIKESIIEKLEQEVNELNKASEIKKENQKGVFDKLVNEHAQDRREWEEEREELLKRRHEMERLLRKSNGDNIRLRQEYQRLAELLQASVSKSILHTFTENHVL